MKLSHKITLFFTVLIITTINSQDKLKGNKEVTTEDRTISDFNKLEIIDDVDVFLSFNEIQSVSVETDANLQEAVITEVNNGTLVIKLSTKIVRKKELAVHIKVNRKLKEINGYNSAKIISKNSLAIDSLTINTFDNSKLDLKLNSKTLQINSKKSSDLKLEVLSNSITINAEENSDIKGAFDAKGAFFTLLDRASINVEGSSDIFEIETLGNTSFKGKDFKSKEVLVNATNSSSTHINATKTIDLRVKNSAEVYLYSNPKITITEFFDKASLNKRD
ncbi:DUF2807 domain-containing protein [Lutibacter sp.]|uniref:GIN domain-containing protein n=1 Tax=Lutibacter sp. TaxID=1925666 RepID=UPI0034A013D2